MGYNEERKWHGFAYADKARVTFKIKGCSILIELNQETGLDPYS